MGDWTFFSICTILAGAIIGFILLCVDDDKPNKAEQTEPECAVESESLLLECEDVAARAWRDWRPGQEVEA